MQGEAWKDKIDAGKTQRMWVLVSGTKNTVVLTLRSVSLWGVTYFANVRGPGGLVS